MNNKQYKRFTCFNHLNLHRQSIEKRILTGLIILSLYAFVFSFFIQSASAGASVSIQSASLDKSTYVPGETVKVKVTIKNTGTIDLSDLKINVDIADPNGNNVIASTLKSGISVSKGKTYSTDYTGYYTIPKDSIAGRYKITVGLWNSDSSTQYDIKYRTASFNVKIPPTPTTPKPTTPKPTTSKPTTPKPTTPKPTTPTPPSPKILAAIQSASLEKSAYSPGENVKVKVTIKNTGTIDLSNLKINVDIADPNGNNVIASTLKNGISVSKGKTYSTDYTGYYTIPKDSIAGTYKITVGLWNSDSSQQYDIKYRTASFNVKIPPTPTTPKPTTSKPTTPKPTTPTPPPPKQQPTSVEKSTYNSGDVVVQEISLDKSSYKPGETAKVKFSIKNKGNSDLFGLKINVNICETSPCKDTTLKSIGLRAGQVYSSDYMDFYRIPDNPTLDKYGLTIDVLSSDNKYYDGKYKSFTIETKEKGSASIIGSIVLDKLTYYPDDIVKILFQIKNTGNVAISSLKIKTEVADPEGNVRTYWIGSNIKKIDAGDYYSVEYVPIVQDMDTSVTGTYKLTVTLLNSDNSYIYDTGHQSFIISSPRQSSAELKLSASLRNVVIDKTLYHPGETIKFNLITIKNTGTIDLSGLKVRVLLIDPEGANPGPKDIDLQTGISIKAGEQYDILDKSYYTLPDKGLRYGTYKVEVELLDSSSGLFDKNEKQRFELKPKPVEIKNKMSTQFYDSTFERNGHAIEINLYNLRDIELIGTTGTMGVAGTNTQSRTVGYAIPLKISDVRKGDNIKIKYKSPIEGGFYGKHEVGLVEIDVNKQGSRFGETPPSLTTEFSIDAEGISKNIPPYIEHNVPIKPKYIGDYLFSQMAGDALLEVNFDSLGNTWIFGDEIEKADFDIIIYVTDVGYSSAVFMNEAYEKLKKAYKLAEIGDAIIG